MISNFVRKNLKHLSKTQSIMKNFNTATFSNSAIKGNSMDFRKISEIRTLNYGPDLPEETVFEKNKKTMKKVSQILRNDVCTVLGYGPQGQAQALNLRDSSIKVCVGVREDGVSWKKAIEDGFVPGETLFSIKDAVDNGTIVMYLLSDAGQIDI